ncbi:MULTISPECIES: CMD domain-containing protein [Enterobacterales]|uniref:carboxymuconolactone decarboxylase family protein n=1 Tax=Enterobacterales TaxID=91347 RepID=UPI002ED78A58
MEQRRVYGKGQWYHETQARNQAADVLPLVPEAAHVADRFLLDLTLPEQVSDDCQPWLHLSSKIAVHLFPNDVAVTRLNTFSAYDRLSTALTVAQVFGVQRLCNHYAARLAPLPGPDSSRESNHRLAQITQYARQLAGSPSVICSASRQQLDAVGLSVPDIVLMTQIVGFVGYQARVMAVGQALLGLPVRWLPGMPVQEEAPASLFDAQTQDWKSDLDVIENHDFSNLQLDALLPLLAWDKLLLRLEIDLLDALHTEPEYATLVAVLNARINGSASCFWQHAQDESLLLAILEGENALQQWGQNNPAALAVIQAVQLLTKAPDRFSAAQFTPLLDNNLSPAQAFTLLALSGVNGWLNRLKIGLGEALPVT